MKLAATCIAILLIVTASAQNGKTVSLRWKLQPREILNFKTVMLNIDTSKAREFSLGPDRLSGLFGNTIDNTNEIRQFFSTINSSFAKADFNTKLSENTNGIIDIEMDKKEEEAPASKKDTDNIITGFPKMMKKLGGNVMLRGALNDDGSIQSFYVKNDQKNLIAIFFELPHNDVKVGDIWPLAVNLISMDQNFTCDTSFKKNTCKLVELKKAGNETIAVLRYDLGEYISGDYYSASTGTSKKSTLKMTYNGLAEFSVEKGRWATYNGIMTLRTTGISTAATMQKIALTAD
ncbi:MAG: hypothetical protein ABJC98_10510 [Bacteroidota bacterium]